MLLCYARNADVHHLIARENATNYECIKRHYYRRPYAIKTPKRPPKSANTGCPKKDRLRWPQIRRKQTPLKVQFYLLYTASIEPDYNLYSVQAVYNPPCRLGVSNDMDPAMVG